MFLHCDRNKDFWIFPWIQSEIAIFVAYSLYLYEYIDSEFETAYKQATIAAFIQKILLGRMSWTERELHNVQFFQRMHSLSSKIQRDKSPCAEADTIDNV